jgi:hypothetical protein
VPIEKRSQFMERIAAMLKLRGRGHFTDSDVGDAVKLALVGMIHENARDPQFARMTSATAQ